MASTRSSGPTHSPWPMRSLMPRSSWERMTPEFPRAPISEPCPMARQTSGMPAPFTPSSSVTTASRVSAMFVPVSPSGTG